MTGRNGERGAVLVAALLVLALLSLLGAGAMLRASLNTQATGNQKESRISFYAAEAALDYGVDQILAAARDPLDSESVLPIAMYVADGVEKPVGAIPGFSGPVIPDPANSAAEDYDLFYVVDVVPGENDTTGEAPEEKSWSSTENAQSVLNYSRNYTVTGIAKDSAEPEKTQEVVREAVRILRRPLSQYLAFYQGDMNWRPQTLSMMTVAGGRVHASGSIYLAPKSGITFDRGTLVVAMTAGGGIQYDQALNEGGGVGGGVGGAVNFLNPSLATPGFTVPTPGVTLTAHVSATTQATMEKPFLLNSAPQDGIVRIGVDAMRPMKVSAIARGGFYDRIARNYDLPEPGIDCIHISESGIWLTYWPGPVTTSVTDKVENYLNAAGDPVTINDGLNDPDSLWPKDARGNADGSWADDTANTPIPRSMVYYPGRLPIMDETRAAILGASDPNVDYPATLETADPREGMAVEFTVVDLQRLEYWYRDYLIEAKIATPTDFLDRRLLVYATRPAGTSPLQAIKVIGSHAGRWRRLTSPKTGVTKDPVLSRQAQATAVVPTTFVTDLPLYIEGDFSSTVSAIPGGGTISTSGGAPIVVLADSVTLLSNSWGVKNNPTTPAASIPPTWDTSCCAAFFAGRHDPASGSGPAEGVENLLRLMENWDGTTLYISGSLNSLWYSTKTIEEFDEGVFVPPSTYLIGWNQQFKDLPPWKSPPYIPSVYMVERRTWQEN